MTEKEVLFYEDDVETLGISITDIPTEASSLITKVNDSQQHVYQYLQLVLQKFLCACYLTENEALIQQILRNHCFISVIPLIAGLQSLKEDSQSSKVAKFFRRLLKTPADTLVIDNMFSETRSFYCLIASVFEFSKDLPEKYIIQEILRTPYLTRHRTGQVERLMACDQIEAKIMKYHTLSGGGMSAVNLAKFNRKILLSSKSN